MRTTLNISDRPNAEEQALKDAIRYKKLQKLFALKGKIEFDEEYLEDQRRSSEISPISGI